jgi:hypothetical protein
LFAVVSQSPGLNVATARALAPPPFAVAVNVTVALAANGAEQAPVWLLGRLEGAANATLQLIPAGADVTVPPGEPEWLVTDVRLTARVKLAAHVTAM